MYKLFYVFFLCIKYQNVVIVILYYALLISVQENVYFFFEHLDLLQPLAAELFITVPNR